MKAATKLKKISLIGICFIVIFIFIFLWYLLNRFSYAEKFPFYSVKVVSDSSLTIGIIGASWVAGAKLDSFLHHALLQKGFKNKIISSGHPGATGKLIYKHLFEENKKEHSSKFIIENSPDYCIVIGGVNDAISQLGGNFYSYHMIQIIKTLLHYNIKPIIISLPEFGIKETNDKLDYFSKNRNIITAWFNNNGQIDNIKTYRKIFEKKLAAEHLKDSIMLIDFDNVCADYNKCPELYANPAHLSGKGNEKLCHIITNDLIRKINTP